MNKVEYKNRLREQKKRDILQRDRRKQENNARAAHVSESKAFRNQPRDVSGHTGTGVQARKDRGRDSARPKDAERKRTARKGPALPAEHSRTGHKPDIRAERRRGGNSQPISQQRVGRKQERVRRSRVHSQVKPDAPELAAHRRGKANRRSATLVAALFFLFILVYLITSLHAFLVTPHIPTDVVRMGSVDVPQAIDGIIIRDEYVYYANNEGRINFNVSDYERVKAGTKVCEIQDAAEAENINERVISIEEQIINLHEQLRQDISEVDPAVQKVNAQIKNIMDNRAHHFTALNLTEMYNLKDSIAQSVNVRNQMILDDNQNTKEELTLEQEQLINRLNEYVTVMKADRSGVISPVIDGLEQTLTLDKLHELSREDTQRQVDYDKIVLTKEVKPEDPVYKIVASNIWYIAAYIPNETVEGYEEGDIYTLYLEVEDEDVPVSAQVDSIDAGYRDSYVVFKCTKNMIDFLNMRSVTFSGAGSIPSGYKISNAAVATRSYLKIPLEYLYEAGTQAHVMKQAGENTEIVPLAVFEKDDLNFYVAEGTFNLAVGDVLVKTEAELPAYELTETAPVRGVYKVNNGYAEFVRITTDVEDISSETYILLDPALNPGIQAYDNIVSDAAGVKDMQIIR